MGIEVIVADNEELEKWDDIVDSSSQGTIFHKLDWLKITEKHTASKLYPLIGYEGQEIVGLFPLFYIGRPFLRMLFSPPPQAGIPYMGMIMKFPGDKRDKKERLLSAFLEGAFRFADDVIGANYISFKLPPGLHDIREFIWNGYSSKPSYDYMLETVNRDLVWENFSKGLRKNIRRAEDAGLLFAKQAPDVTSVYKSLKQRYNSQGIRFTLREEYLNDLIGALRDNVEYFVVHFDHRLVSELLCLRYKGGILIWLGGYSSTIGDATGRAIYPNEYLHWKVIEYALDNGLQRVEIIGANTPQLCQFKAKYNPSLLLSFSVKKGSILSSMVERAYALWKFKLMAPAALRSIRECSKIMFGG